MLHTPQITLRPYTNARSFGARKTAGFLTELIHARWFFFTPETGIVKETLFHTWKGSTYTSIDQPSKLLRA